MEWKLDICEYSSPEWAPNLTKLQKMKKIKKWSPAPFSLQHPGKPTESPFGRFKGSRRLFYFSKCKKIRPGALRGPKIDPEWSQKLNTNSWINFTLLSFITFILFYLLLFLFLYFLIFIFYVSSCHLGFFFCFGLFDFIVWLFFFILPFILHSHFFFLSHHLYSTNFSWVLIIHYHRTSHIICIPITHYSQSFTFYFYSGYIFLVLLFFQITFGTLPWY